MHLLLGFPYDGNDIGNFKYDTIRETNGWFEQRPTNIGGNYPGVITRGDGSVFGVEFNVGGLSGNSVTVQNVTPETGHQIKMKIGNSTETSSVSISVLYCISY